MKKIIVLITAVFSLSAFAVGPFPDGVYRGTSTCTTSYGETFQDKVDLTFSATQLNWNSTGDSGPANHTHNFVEQEDGFFMLLDFGEGYFTTHGMHYKVTINGMKGEDTYLLVDDKIYLISSVDVQGNTIKCEGVFTAL